MHQVHARFVSFGIHKPQERSHSETDCTASIAILNKSRQKHRVTFKEKHLDSFSGIQNLFNKLPTMLFAHEPRAALVEFHSYFTST